MASELSFVSGKDALELCEGYTKEEPHMARYWETAAAYVSKQEQRSFPMAKVDDEFAAFEESYFKGESPVIHIHDMDSQQTDSRMMKWMWFTK